jgi:hypothetical protein
MAPRRRKVMDRLMDALFDLIPQVRYVVGAVVQALRMR